MRTETRAVSTLNPGSIRTNFEQPSAVISLHMVVSSRTTALRLPVLAVERRREIVLSDTNLKCLLMFLPQRVRCGSSECDAEPAFRAELKIVANSQSVAP